MSDRPQPNVLIVCKDLLFSSQLTGSVQRTGLTPRTCLGQKTALSELNQNEIQWVIVDLELEQLDLTAIRSATTAKLVAFGPHVHEEKLKSAQAAGFDYVLSRGQISSGLDDLMTSQTDR